MSLLKNVKITRVGTYTAAGATDVSEVAVVDMAGYDGVMFVCGIGAVTATAVYKLIPTHSSATSTTDQVDLSSTSYGGGYSGSTAGTTGMSNLNLVVDVYKPLKRYVSARLDRATANVVLHNIDAIQYTNRKGPVTQSTGSYGVLDSDLFVSPTTA